MEEDKYDLIYNTPHKLCRCRDEDNKLTPVVRNHYRNFFNELKEGKEAIKILNDMGIMKMCCRERFLCIPIDHLIDRSKERYFNHEKRSIISNGTRELTPGVDPPNFPVLPF